MELLTQGTKVTLIQAALADGATDPDSDRVDMAGFDGVTFICVVGTITGTGTVSMQVKQAATDIAGDALSGCVAQADLAADSDKLLIVDVMKPTDRYLGVTLTRGTANSVIGGVIAIQYQAKHKPTTHTAATLADAVDQAVTPAES